MDKYNKMLTALTSVMTNLDGLNNASSILSIMEPLIDGKDEKKN